MLNQNNREAKQHNYYRYLNVPIVPACCADNGFHRDMYDRGAKDGFLITFTGQPQHSFRSIDVSEMVTEYGKLMDELAYFSAVELRQSGLPLQVGVERKYQGSLINSYLINSCLVYVEKRMKQGKESFFATKSLAVIHSLANELAEADRQKKVEHYLDQLTTSHAELSQNKFEIVKLVNDRGGMKISKGTVNCNQKETIIMPMYSIGNYIDKLIHLLSNRRVLISYLEDGDEYKAMTSLRSDILARWLGTNHSATIKKAQTCWQNPFHYGEVILPNLLVSNEFVTIQVLDIISIQMLE